jgi:hypothetical protein
MAIFWSGAKRAHAGQANVEPARFERQKSDLFLTRARRDARRGHGGSGLVAFDAVAGHAARARGPPGRRGVSPAFAGTRSPAAEQKKKQGATRHFDAPSFSRSRACSEQTRGVRRQFLARADRF